MYSGHLMVTRKDLSRVVPSKKTATIGPHLKDSTKPICNIFCLYCRINTEKQN